MNMRETVLMTATVALAVCPATAVDIYKADNSDALNLGSSWEGGTVPAGGTAVAVWDNRISSANTTVPIGGGLSFNSLRVEDPGGDVVITGAQTLRVEGGTLPGVYLLSTAARDLTVSAPMMLASGANVTVAEGRTVTFANSLNLGGGINKRGAGTLVVNQVGLDSNQGYNFHEGTVRFTGNRRVSRWLAWPTNGTATVFFDGTFNMDQHINLFNGTAILNSGAFTSTGPNLVVGYNYGEKSDGLLIVSNGMHRFTGGVGGTADFNSTHFIGGWGGKRGRLIVEDGSLMFNYLRFSTDNRNQRATGGVGGQTIDTPDQITVNGGLLQVLGTDQPFKMGVKSISSEPAGCQRWGVLTVNGGRFEVPNGEFHFSDNPNGGADITQDIILNGGTLAISNMVVGSHNRMVRTVTFDGGTLEGTNITDGAELVTNPERATWRVCAGGAMLSAAAGSDFTFSANLVEDGMSTGGGLTKEGPGLAVLAGVNTYTGPTVVSNGWLGISGSVDDSCGLLVAGDAGLMLADENEAAQELAFDWAVFEDGAGLCVDTGDVIHARTLEIGGAGLVDVGLEEGMAGSFRVVLMTYDTIIGTENLVGWTVVNDDGSGYAASIRAENDEVVLTRRSTRGTVILVQ